ncbi:MAG: twin-arginine translocation signal domain-containing protein, partial [Cyclobacteriaceae bacterium]|nr:twin-arginine translocation signal domain-containing protein [Cyclobacteriaceae bacterium]
MHNRREFIRQSALAGAGMFLAPAVFSRAISENEKVVIGMVGTNSRGHYLATMLAQLPDVEIGYICDVDANVLSKTTSAIEKQTGKKPKGYKDVRKLLEEKDLDA